MQLASRIKSDLIGSDVIGRCECEWGDASQIDVNEYFEFEYYGIIVNPMFVELVSHVSTGIYTRIPVPDYVVLFSYATL